MKITLHFLLDKMEYIFKDRGVNTEVEFWNPVIATEPGLTFTQLTNSVT